MQKKLSPQKEQGHILGIATAAAADTTPKNDAANGERARDALFQSFGVSLR